LRAALAALSFCRWRSFVGALTLYKDASGMACARRVQHVPQGFERRVDNLAAAVIAAHILVRHLQSHTARAFSSPTHPYNLLFKLDPIKAYDLRLVKRIEVTSVRSADNFNDAYAKLIGTDSTNGIRARIEIHKEGKSGPSGHVGQRGRARVPSCLRRSPSGHCRQVRCARSMTRADWIVISSLVG
jgi:hypothetical protein